MPALPALTKDQQRVICRNVIQNGEYVLAAWARNSPDLIFLHEGMGVVRWKTAVLKAAQELDHEIQREIARELYPAVVEMENEKVKSSKKSRYRDA